uniref:Uncharacterized protein n=1 Tax=Oryza brachyantha TaxID=4533 RepID=J3MFB6_ORYBR
MPQEEASIPEPEWQGVTEQVKNGEMMTKHIYSDSNRVYKPVDDVSFCVTSSIMGDKPCDPELGSFTVSSSDCVTDFDFERISVPLLDVQQCVLPLCASSPAFEST